ncbi:hypothetical protein D1007_53808 [Hordeum vulgare]|nr:hypothetical protein D1007_53808 [Hordeum vulgare]
MHVNSEQRWVAYKETGVESLDRALELFSTKKVDANLHLNLNPVASPIIDNNPPHMNEDDMSEPLLTQQVRPTLTPILKIQDEALQDENNEYEDDENDDLVIHDNNVGDLNKYYLQETMEHSIMYSHGYASESNNDGLDEEADEEVSRPRRSKLSRRYYGGIIGHHCSKVLVL